MVNGRVGGRCRRLVPGVMLDTVSAAAVALALLPADKDDSDTASETCSSGVCTSDGDRGRVDDATVLERKLRVLSRPAPLPRHPCGWCCERRTGAERRFYIVQTYVCARVCVRFFVRFWP